MRRLRRILLNAATGVSLLLCIATAALWIRSHWREDRYLSQVTEVHDDHGITSYRLLWSNKGVIIVYNRKDRVDKTTAVRLHASPERGFSSGQSVSEFAGPDGPVYNKLGFGSFHVVPGDLGLAFPHAALVVAFLILPSLRLRRLRYRFRYQVGLCPTCGYDLRATPERCPECGTCTTP